ncbi:multicopper oxidase family protein [Streptomyces sp. ZAF1911]|uniref:multicopper oxidase family protein n=1 Tax=Streptomyces sp. ZAF1911 TaxID=2944129 RepID=UPI00237C2604|nr:multicopper oxidase family protein [Streptomyces sp. ZAF1911]MDD9375774.1 multicopper oxidase family protein [Streptomyces sp. ZAF1911]
MTGTGGRTPRTAMARRRFLGLGAGLTVAGLTGTLTTGCSPETSGELLRSGGARLPRRFTVPLPVPRTAQAVGAGGPGGGELFEVVQRAAPVEVLPGVRTTVWGYDGTFPGPTFRVRSGRAATVRVTNELAAPTSTHLHGGVTPADSDGYPTDLVVPAGGFRPGDGPVRTGHGGHVGGSGGGHGAMPGGHVPPDAWTLHERTRDYVYPLDRQRAATLWYHDHRMDFTGPQVWRGLAGFFLVSDAAEDASGLPGGARDIPLMLCDRSFDADGQFRYPALDPSLTGVPGVAADYMEGVLGDVLLVNGAPWPEMEVDAARYRFRFLNASNARRYRLRLSPPPPDGSAPFVQVGSDAGLLAGPRPHYEVPLSPAERFDLVVDFGRYPVGTLVTVRNTLGETEATRDVMRFRVVRSARDDSVVRPVLAELDLPRQSEAVRTRVFDFRRTEAAGAGSMWTINGRPFEVAADLADPALGTVERWRFSSDFHHPVHVHLAHFAVVGRGAGGPLDTDGGWKDTVDVRPFEVVEVLARFDGYKGRYMMHCHNLEHEDMAMMANFRVV